MTQAVDDGKTRTSPQLLVLVPTRDRPDLALRTTASLLEQSDENTTVVISDNGTTPLDAGGVAEVIRPPEPLAMAAHWEWATRTALERYRPTHFAILTDRLTVRPGGLADLRRIVEAYPDRVLCYPLPNVSDHDKPVRYVPPISTRSLYVADSAVVRSIVSRGEANVWTVPRLMNTIVPVSILNQVVESHGHLFGQLSPDYHSGFHILAATSDFLVTDDGFVFQHSLARSNGMSNSWGARNSASTDFLRLSGPEHVPLQVPIPEIWTVSNTIFHDFLEVGRETGMHEPIDLEGYRHRLRLDARALWANPSLGKQYLNLLGCKDDVVEPPKKRRLVVPFRVAKFTGPLLRLAPPGMLSFDSSAAALDFAMNVMPVRSGAPNLGWPPGAVAKAQLPPTKDDRCT